MLITAIFHVQPEGYQEPDNEDGLKYQPDYPVNGIQSCPIIQVLLKI